MQKHFNTVFSLQKSGIKCVIDILYFTLLTKEVIYLKMNVILQDVPYR